MPLLSLTQNNFDGKMALPKKGGGDNMQLEKIQQQDAVKAVEES